eukprot:IDg14876t1
MFADHDFSPLLHLANGHLRPICTAPDYSGARVGDETSEPSNDETGATRADALDAARRQRTKFYGARPGRKPAFWRHDLWVSGQRLCRGSAFDATASSARDRRDKFPCA